MEKAGIIEKVNTLLAVKGLDVPASALDFFYEESYQYILNYCNIYELPIELEHIIVKMIVNQCVINGNISNCVNSISEGGRSVSFSNSLDIAKIIDKDIKEVLNKYKVFYK